MPPFRPLRARATAMVVAGLALAATACGVADTTAPAPSSSLSFSQSEDSRLKAELEREKIRIVVAQEASKATQDLLKIEWERFQKTNPDKERSPFLVCDPIQYTGKAEIVGPEGKDIGFGPHKLYIPRGALSKRVVITAEALTSLNVVAKFGPHGLVFNPAKRPKLELNYKHCFGQSSIPARIVYVNDLKQMLEFPTSTDVKQLGLVWAHIGHFSGYMVSSGREEDLQ